MKLIVTLGSALGGVRWAVADSAIQLRQHSLGADNSFLRDHRFLPEEKRAVSPHACGVTTQVHSGSDKYEVCPSECPYYAQNIGDGLHCTFLCVRAEQCREMNPNRPIADELKGQKICRGPMVPDCAEMSLDGTDTCLKCQLFYKVGDGSYWNGGADNIGKCVFQHWWIAITVIAICFLGFCGVCVWIIDWCLRPVTNDAGLKQGLSFRTAQKIHTPRVEGRQRELFPDDTNLCRTEVAGPGMLLHFNYQALCVVWAFAVGLVWFLFAVFADNALFTLGTRKFGTPRENCILVAWGYETQQRLMWTKVWFLIITYFFTFIGSLLHGVRQMRIFDSMDAETKSMKDFCAILEGIDVDGNPKWEKEIADAVEKATGKQVLGVSIAWIYKDDLDMIESVLEEDLADREKRRATGVTARTTYDQNVEVNKDENRYEKVNGLRKAFMKTETYLFGAGEYPTEPEEGMKTFLQNMQSSEEAFVIFNTESEKDGAIAEVAESGIEFNGQTLKLSVCESEPEAIKWENYGHSSLGAKVRRFVQGLGAILLALFFWTTVFYTPYAYQVFTFNYDNGAEPPFTLAMTFCMVVVLGNAIMYEVCGRVSDYIGFKTRDHRESCYLILYVVSCMFNVTLDMVTTYFMSVQILEGLNFRTYHGVKLKDLPTFTAQFESYGMQRVLAENTKAYCFPATFLIPFLIEPFITVYFPLMLGKLMVQSHPEWVGRDAELWMVAFEFDMGRYGDLLLNQLLGILIFFFPGGYTLLLFWGMAGSHLYIYLFDHLRVLKTIPKCVYATMEVDWWAQWMLGPITATIASCWVFKANCQGWGFCVQGWTLIEYVVAAWIGHLVLHHVCLCYLVPLARRTDLDDPRATMTFKECAEELPCSWFASNPIHCLRSKFLHEDSPPCSYYYLGKEHLQAVNPKINCHFFDEHCTEEDYSNGVAEMSKVGRTLTNSIKNRLTPGK